MFGLIGHLTDLAHAQEVAHDLGYDEYASQGLEFWCMAPPQAVDEISITSITGQVIHGTYIESCFLPEMLSGGKFKTASRKILNAMAHAQKQCLDITALGGFASIIFENFNLEKMTQVRDITLDLDRFTTGNTHTAYVICEQARRGASALGMDLARSQVAVIGATGDIGSAVCRWLSQRAGVEKLLLVARNQERLTNLQTQLGYGTLMTLEQALPVADVIIWVAALGQAMQVDPGILKTPCLIIDGGYPKNLQAAIQREGIYVLEGGIVEHALDINWKIKNFFRIANPTRRLFACFAESMLLEFEGLHTSYSWGRNQITPERMDEIGSLSRKHGFQPLGISS
ncbi:long-chain acyl-[acyl-carrier-protein] reductase [Candidatus Cyanaurora vandensis]|uniref:long-chain acyl-[acyl-carrier-protein] reductase n=1 Tax=Candidatus Cyanaurora vandensis TaxID=2714958 RepID=UPI00257EEFD0|nr:long-chain acyl-[acyl-carrier-protein] reductase [Candidatus Cyanaurora vandensis]